MAVAVQPAGKGRKKNPSINERTDRQTSELIKKIWCIEQLIIKFIYFCELFHKVNEIMLLGQKESSMTLT